MTVTERMMIGYYDSRSWVKDWHDRAEERRARLERATRRLRREVRSR